MVSMDELPSLRRNRRDNREDQRLEPLEPREGIDQYIDARRPDVTSSTVSGYETKLGYFETFCNREEITNLNRLDGRRIESYQVWRRQHSTGDELSPVTMEDDCYLLHDFLEYLASINAVREGLCDQVRFPDTDGVDDVRDIELSEERLTSVLSYLEKYEYATREHVTVLLGARLAARPSDVYALDLDDVYLDGDSPYIEFQNRPEQTRLKKGDGGERQAAISESVRDVLKDYIEQNRVETTTTAGRKPLLTTQHGRLSKSTMRKDVYKWTCPCRIDGNCPHDRDPSECEARQRVAKASTCPSSLPPYALRHGFISSARRKGVAKAVLSDRCDVSEEILEKHYDERTEAEKREARREAIEAARGETGGGYL